MDEAIIHVNELVAREQIREEDVPEFLSDRAFNAHKKYLQSGKTKYLDWAVKLALHGIARAMDTSAPQPNLVTWLIHLMVYLSDLYKVTGQSAPLGVAIQMGRMAVIAAEDRQPDKAVALHTLGAIFAVCYMRTKQPTDLLKSICAAEQAASSLVDEQAVASTIDRYPIWPIMVNNLGTGLYHLYELTDELAVLDMAIESMRVAVTCTPDGHSKRWVYLMNLGNFLNSRYKKTRKESDLGESVTAARQAANSIPDNHPDQAKLLNNLGNLLNLWYDYTKKPEDVDEAVQAVHRAVLASKDTTFHATYLASLSIMLERRYEAAGRISDIEDSVRNARKAQDALCYLPKGHLDEGKIIRYLGNHLQTRYEVTGNYGDLEEAINLTRQVIASTDENHPDLSDILDDLATNLHLQHERTLELQNIDEAIHVSREALRRAPKDHHNQPIYLANLGNNLERRYEHTWEVSNLEESIELTRHALSLESDSRLQYAVTLGSLGNKLEQLYGQTGDSRWLEEAIQVTQRATELAACGSLSKADRLSDLGNQLEIRYERSGELEDLQRAIEKAELAIELTPKDHPSRAGKFNNLSVKLHSRYMRIKLVPTQEDAIHAARQAVYLTPHDHQDQKIYLGNLGTQLHQLYQRTGKIEHLEEAIRSQRQAVETMPHTHISRISYLHNLGLSLQSLYEKNGQVQHLQEAIKYAEQAVDSTPPSHPARARRLISLGQLLETRHELANDKDDEERVFKYAVEAWECVNAIPFDRVKAGARGLRLLAAANRVGEGITLGVSILDLLPKVHTRNLDRDDQQFVLSTFSGVASTLAWLFLKAGLLPEAVQYLEQGRTVIINQLLDDRSDISALYEDHPDLAEQFQNLVDELNSVSYRDRDNRPANNFVKRRREAAAELDACLNNIRSTPRHKHFLMGQTVHEIQECAAEGYIVIVNITEFGSDAILISRHTLMKVELSEQLAHEAKDWLTMKWTINGCSQQRPKNDSFLKYLSWLWDLCVKPILDKIATTRSRTVDDLPRVWWIGCGLASSMPLHAAGVHEENSVENTYSRIISSYTPSIKALAHARRRAKQTKEALDVRSSMLIVTMPTTPNGPADKKTMGPLPKVTEEKDGVLESIHGHISPTVLEHPSVEQVSEILKKSCIAHFACHGVSNRVNPSNSGLILQRKGESDCVVIRDRLTVHRVSELTLERAQIAYLSACSTAENKAARLSDEVIHVASGFQVAGFPHVIGCLWPTGESECLDVATRFYSSLFQQSTAGISDNVAVILQEAVQAIRGSQIRTPLNWAQFVHYGA